MEEDNRITYRITDLAETDRPRERLAEVGPKALNNAELLAILLRVGIRGENAVQMGHRATFEDVCNQKGIGPAKAAQIKAAIELGRRLAKSELGDRPAINSPKDASDLVMYEMSALQQEHLWVINLDTKNQVINIERLYKGSLNSSTVRIGEVFKSAIQRNAASVIILHNHPSGDPAPSPEDVALTRAVVEAGRLLDIEVLDHLVIGQGRFVSMKDRKLGFKSE